MIDSRIKTAVRAMREARTDAPACLTIIGPPGTGKTHSGAILRRWCHWRNQWGKMVFWRTCYAFSQTFPSQSLARLFMMGASFTESDAAIRDLDYLNEGHILFVDDLGSEPKWIAPETMAAGVCDILDSRRKLDRFTIITSNLKPDEILTRYGARLHSRMIVGAALCILTGEDRRMP